jgi:hypothetical protein
MGQLCDGTGSCRNGRGLIPLLGTSINIDYGTSATIEGTGQGGVCGVYAVYPIIGDIQSTCGPSGVINFAGAVFHEDVTATTDCISNPGAHLTVVKSPDETVDANGRITSFQDEYGFQAVPLALLRQGTCSVTINQTLSLDGVAVDVATITINYGITNAGCSIVGSPTRTVQ